MIGGPVYYLVQSADVIPPTATPMPTATPKPTFTSTPASTPTAPPTSPSRAPQAILVTDAPELANEAIVDFPETVTFRLELDVEEPIVEATLIYQLGREGCLVAGTHVPVEVTGSSLEWTWVMSRSGNPPPGAKISWHWEVTGASGNTITTPAKELTFADERFEWRTIEAQSASLSAPIRLHWYEGEEVGPVLLEAAMAGLERLQQDTGIELQGEVQFFIYADSEDMREALLYVQDWAGGIAFTDYNTILIGVPPHLAETWGSSTVRHELAHLVINQFSLSCLGGSLPNWLSEGLAVYAEGEPDEQTLKDIEEGIEGDLFQPVRTLNGSFPAQGDAASAAYSQSYSLVNYLLDTYGQEKIQELLLVLAGATSYDAALEKVYGFNADGLEVAWRKHIGAPLRQIPPTPTPFLAANVPTVVPLNPAQSWPTPLAPGALAATSAPTDSALDPGRNITVCGLGLVPLLLLIGLGTVVITRQNLKKD
jgi:hypothetical protein